MVVMGVSGCGKSTVGRALATALGFEYLEGDKLHPAHNIELMAAGTPLTDGDRGPWLRALADALGEAHRTQRGLVLTCSALKRSYRDRLRSGTTDLRFLHLHGSPDLLAERMGSRPGHFMPESLLQSQLDTLEVPTADEQVLTLDIALPVTEQVARAVHHYTEAEDPAKPTA